MLIKCPECGHDVSDTAVNCPNCGYGVQENIEEIRVKIDEQAKLDSERKAKDEERRKRFFVGLKKRWILVALGALVLVFGGIVIYNVVKISKYGFEDCKTAWLIKTERENGEVVSKMVSKIYPSQDDDILHFTTKALLLDDGTEDDVDIYCIPCKSAYTVYASKYDETKGKIVYLYLFPYLYDHEPDMPYLLGNDLTEKESHLQYKVLDILNDYQTNKDNDDIEKIKYDGYHNILIRFFSKNIEVVEIDDVEDLY